jgi:4-hydroxybenzoate polyprenyltransferase
MALTIKERTVAMLIGIAGAAAFGWLSARWMVVGAALAIAMSMTAALQRRVPTAVLAFVTGLGPWWDGFIVFGAVFIVLAFLLVRAGRQEVHDGADRRGSRR